jgi:hypothetical protein
MKDFDDLWRLSQSNLTLNRLKLKKLLLKRKVSAVLLAEWISEDLDRSWASHQKRYKDLPENLVQLFKTVNLWLE